MKITKSLFFALFVFTASQQAYASGFALIENSASGMGNAYAGAAAVAEDGSTIWFNPAGMTKLKKKTVSGVFHAVNAKTEYTDRGSSINPLLTGLTEVRGSLSGPNDEIDEVALVPNLYYVNPLSEDVVFGLGINVPFGLSTEYEDNWVGRYHGLFSSVSTLNINPSLGFQFTPEVSFGVGLNFQYIEAELSNKIDSSALCLNLAQGDAAFIGANCVPNGLTTPGQSGADSEGSLKGDDYSFGYNLGVLYESEKGNRLGFSYRSGIQQNLEGEVDFTVDPGLQNVLNTLGAGGSPAGLLLSDADITAGIEVPASASISAAMRASDRLQVLMDVTWTEWSNFQELRVNFDNFVQPDSVTEEEWKNVLRYSLGGNYQMTDSLVLRAGIALDKEAIPDAQHRTPRIPGNDRTWVSLGAGYDITPRIHVDVGYSHLFVADSAVEHTDGNGYTIRGEFDASVDIISTQLNWTF